MDHPILFFIRLFSKIPKDHRFLLISRYIFAHYDYLVSFHIHIFLISYLYFIINLLFIFTTMTMLNFDNLYCFFDNYYFSYFINSYYLIYHYLDNPILEFIWKIVSQIYFIHFNFNY